MKILDCTIRDGGYLNDWKFNKSFMRETYRALSRSGVDYMEIGFRGTDKYFDKEKFGLWRFSTEEDIRDVTKNINGAKLAIMADFGKVELDDFLLADESCIDLVRLAVNKNDVKLAVQLLEKIKEKGYKVAFNAMGYANYSISEQKDMIELLRGSEIDIVYVADSYGSIFPNQIQELFEPLLEIPGIEVGFHPHNSLQMAFANSLEAIKCGVHIVDSTIYGMGRAAGNLPTEIIIAYLEREQADRYNSIPVLNIIDKHFVPIQKINPWGYQLPYMLSGMFQCHPYYAKSLVDMKEYTIEDIWKTLEYIKKKNPVGFSKKLFNSVMVEGLIGDGEDAKKLDGTAGLDIKQATDKPPKIDYIDKYKGRDFLILANGPSLKQYKTKIDKFIEKYDPIIMGGNYLGDLFCPHYHAFNNKRRFTTYVDSVSEQSRMFLGEHMAANFIGEYTDREYERFYYKDVLQVEFGIKEGVIQTNCRTIAVLLMGVAIVMGAERIFAAGMDGYMGVEKDASVHFYKELDEKEDLDLIVDRHRWCLKFIDQIDNYLYKKGKEGLHILTPTSYKSVYKGIENYV